MHALALIPRGFHFAPSAFTGGEAWFLVDGGNLVDRHSRKLVTNWQDHALVSGTGEALVTGKGESIVCRRE
jgi:hypothetical protein